MKKSKNTITSWLDQHGDPKIDAFIEKNLMENYFLNKIQEQGCRVNKDEKRFFIPHYIKESFEMTSLIRNFGWKGQYEIN